MTRDSDVIVYVISDAAGDTGEYVVRAAIAQFHPISTDIRRAPFVTSKKVLEDVTLKAKRLDAIVMYTLVKPELREYMRLLAEQYDVQAIDLLGSLIDLLEHRTGKISSRAWS